MIRFIADTTFGITKEYAKAHKIKMVNLKLLLDGIESEGGYAGEWDDFYKRLRESKGFPITSQPNPSDFEQAINEIYAEDESAEIIILTIASVLSGTINSARLAAKSYEGKKIAVIDSMNAATCCNLMLEQLVEFANEGNTFEQTVEHCEYLKNKLSIQFVPYTMEYLKRGGRIGKLSAILASIASIKPVFDVRNNIVTVTTKALGLTNAIIAMIKRLPQKIKKLYICYIDDNKNVPLVQKKLNDLRNIIGVNIKPVDPIFGVHVGIGAIGIACLEE